MSQHKNTENQTDGIVREAEEEVAKEHREKKICINEVQIRMKLKSRDICSVEDRKFKSEDPELKEEGNKVTSRRILRKLRSRCSLQLKLHVVLL